MAAVAGRPAKPMTPGEYAEWYEYDATDDEAANGKTPEEYAEWYAATQMRQAVRPARRAQPMPHIDAEPQAAPAGKVSAAGPLVGIFAMIIGGTFWFEAARFTRDGWILALNWLCARLSIPWQVPTLDWRVAFVAALVLGAAYSRVEARPPIRLPQNWRKTGLGKGWRIDRTWQVWIVWLFLIVTDIGSTYVGARARGASADEVQILRDVAASGGALAIYAILLTFAPDGMIRYGWRALFRK